MTKSLPLWQLYWAPEGRPLCQVRARDKRAARRMAPQPYRKYLGEIGVELIVDNTMHAVINGAALRRLS